MKSKFTNQKELPIGSTSYSMEKMTKEELLRRHRQRHARWYQNLQKTREPKESRMEADAIFAEYAPHHDYRITRENVASYE